MLLHFDKFDVILGMDWLTMHDTVVNCIRKTIELKCQSGKILWIEFDDLSELPTVILSMLAYKCMKKGYDAYLAHILDTKVSESKIESVPIVSNFWMYFQKNYQVCHRSERLNLVLN